MASKSPPRAPDSAVIRQGCSFWKNNTIFKLHINTLVELDTNTILHCAWLYAILRDMLFQKVSYMYLSRYVTYMYDFNLAKTDQVVLLGTVSLRLMASQFKDIVTHTQKLKTVKCIFCGVWVQNFVWNFNCALRNFTQNFEPIPPQNMHFRRYKKFDDLWYLRVMTS